MLRKICFSSVDGEPPLFFNVKVALITSLGGLLFGYDIGVIAGALPQLSENFSMNTFQEEFVVSIMLIGAILGACFGGGVADIVGRKSGIQTVCVIFMIGALILATATSVELLLIGRFIVGIGVAISAIVDVAYLTELSPQTARGRLVSTNELMITVGILLAYTVDFAFDVDKSGWRGMFGVSGIIALIQLICISFMPESPNWLVSNVCHLYNHYGWQDRLFEARESLQIMYRDMEPMDNLDGVINNKLLSIMADCQHSNQYQADFMDSLALGLSSSVSVWKPTITRSMKTTATSSFRPSISPKYHKLLSTTDDDEVDDKDRRNTLRRWRNKRNQSSLLLSHLKSEWSRFTDDDIDAEVASDVDDDIDNDVNSETQLMTTTNKSGANSEIEMTTINPQPTTTTEPPATAPTTSIIPSHVFSVPVKPLLISISLMLFQQFCGNANILYYAPLIFAQFKSSSNNEISEREAEFATVIIGIVKVVFTALSMVIIDKFKRRSLLMSGIAAISVSSACLAISFFLSGSSASAQLPLSIVACSVFVAAYSISFGPLGWLIVSELFEPSVRGTAVGFATIANWVGNLIVSFTFLSSIQVMGGPLTFGMYSMITASALVFVYYHVPETSGHIQ